MFCGKTYKNVCLWKFNVKNRKPCICCKYLCVVRNFCRKKLKELTRKVFKFRNIHANKIGKYKIYSFKHCISERSQLMLVYVWKYQRFFFWLLSVKQKEESDLICFFFFEALWEEKLILSNLMSKFLIPTLCSKPTFRFCGWFYKPSDKAFGNLHL